MLIKVCGMRDANNMLNVAACGIQWMGFIFYPQSPRYFQEASIQIPDNIRKVGVFVNADPVTMLSIYIIGISWITYSCTGTNRRNYAENFARKDTESSRLSPFLPKKTSGKPKHMNRQSTIFCLIPAAQVTEVQDKHSTGPY